MGALSPTKILVVDDDLDLCTLIARFLTKHGYEVRTAPDPVHAQGVLESEDISLVITDLMMPHVDGITFTEQLRSQVKYHDLPIILMTAFPSENVVDSGLRKGVSLTLPKPLELSKLLDLVGFATRTPPPVDNGA